MPQPTLGDVHINAPLTNMSFAYTADLNTVFDKLFPVLPVQKKSDAYYTYPKGNWRRLQARKRAPGARSVGSGYTVSNDTYNCDVYALHKMVPDQIRDNADSVFQLDKEATKFVTEQIALKHEQEFASTFFATSTWTGSTTGSDITPGTKWDNASGDPIKDIRTQIRSMKNKTGIRPNKMAFGGRAWDVVLDNAAVIDRIKYGASNRDPAMTNEMILAQILGLEQILVADEVQNTAEEGATDSLSPFFTEDSALLVHAAKAPGIMTPSAGYTFAWARSGAAANSVRVKRMRMEPEESDMIEADSSWDSKLIAADLGVLFVSVDT